MGNIFTYYNGNNQFVIGPPIEIFAIAIYGSNLRKSNLTINTDFECIEEFNSNANTSTLLFRIKYNGSYAVDTFTNKLVFTSNSDDLSAGLYLDFVNDVNNTGLSGTTEDSTVTTTTNPVFTNSTTLHYNRVNIQYSDGSGSGDPHINPLFNNTRLTYMLPTDRKIYKYFDNLDPNERLVINCKMWILSNSHIKYLETLKRRKDPKYNTEKRKFVTVDGKIDELDTSFIKYVSVIYKTLEYEEILVIDMESLKFVECNCLDFNSKVESYELNCTEGMSSETFNISDVLRNKKSLMYSQGIKFNKLRDGSFKREIKIDTKKHGEIIIRLIREYEHPNHRNHIELIFSDMQKVNRKNCCGCLIQINQVETVPTLLHVNESLNVITSSEKIRTLEEYVKYREDIKLKKRERRLASRNFKKRQQIKN